MVRLKMATRGLKRFVVVTLNPPGTRKESSVLPGERGQLHVTCLFPRMTVSPYGSDFRNCRLRLEGGPQLQLRPSSAVSNRLPIEQRHLDLVDCSYCCVASFVTGVLLQAQCSSRTCHVTSMVGLVNRAFIRPTSTWLLLETRKYHWRLVSNLISCVTSW